MNNTITFATLRKFLTGLGFVETVVPGSHVVFEHPSADVVLMLPPYRSREKVNRANLVAVRFHLDANGLVERDEFESLLQEAAV